MHIFRSHRADSSFSFPASEQIDLESVMIFYIVVLIESYYSDMLIYSMYTAGSW